MKRIYAAAIVAALLALPMQAQASPNEDRWHGPCSTWEYGEALTSPAEFQADLPRSIRMMRRLITCVFDEFAPGNASMALYVADRESSFFPWALNASSGCMGLFQHATWTSRAEPMLDRWMFGHWVPGWWDPRANAMVAAKMVSGWGAWSPGWGPWSL